MAEPAPCPALCSMCAEEIDVGGEEFLEGACNKCGDVRVHRHCAIKHGEDTILRLKCNTTALKRLQVSGGGGGGGDGGGGGGGRAAASLGL